MSSLLLLRPILRLRRSPRLILALCAAAICLIGFVDVKTTYELSVSVLFLPPVLVALRFYGRRAGILLCLLSEAFWILDAWRNGLGRVPAPMLFWQNLERLVLFLIVIFLVDAMLASARRGGRLLARERRTSKIKGDMISLVSHELNNSMMMIALAVRELESGKSAASREEVYGVVKRNVSRMGVLAQNFLSEARLASGRWRLRPSSELLEEVAAGVVAALRPLADDKKISVSWSVDPPDLRAAVDRDSFGVALTNLVGNAIKYTPEGGRVAVGARLLEGLPRRASVWVEDNGIGIAAEDQARVVAAFERAESGRRQASGFGLGLKVAHDIIKAHGGSLAIDSKPGKGSRFSFELPA